MDPHLACQDINLWGNGLADGSGTYTIAGWSPSGHQETDYSSNWTYNTSQGGDQMIDVIKVQQLMSNAQTNGDAANNGQGLHFKLQFSQDPQKHKTFWVNCTPPPSKPLSTTNGTRTTTTRGCSVSSHSESGEHRGKGHAFGKGENRGKHNGRSKHNESTRSSHCNSGVSTTENTSSTSENESSGNESSENESSENETSENESSENETSENESSENETGESGAQGTTNASAPTTTGTSAPTNSVSGVSTIRHTTNHKKHKKHKKHHKKHHKKKSGLRHSTLSRRAVRHAGFTG